MKKLFRTMLPAAMLLAAAVAIHAQYDSKAVEQKGANPAEQLASSARRGYVAPRVKTGFGNVLSSPFSGTVSLREAPARAPMKEYIEYVPDIKGMVFAPPSTVLNTISADGTLAPVSTVSLSAGMCTPGGGYGTDDTYYVTLQYSYPGQNIFYAFPYDTETWQMRNGTPFMLSQRFMSTDLTYNPADGLVYGCFTNDAADGYEFGTVDFAEGERTTISALPAAWNAIAADKSGNMFAIDMDGDLLKVDKSNGSVTRIGATGYVPQNLSSATFDHKTGKLYWTVSTDTSGFLCEINTETGAAVKLFDFPNAEEIYALYVMPPAAEDRAPAAPTNLSLDFTDGDLSGTLVFDAPATLFRGEEGSGNVDYRVMLAGETLASGTTTYGATSVRTPEFSVAAPGRYKFTLICSNSEGDSPKAETERFIGADAPAGVTGAKAEYADGTFTVTWNAPAGSANGGYINPSEVRYTVTRMPDNVVVADGISETSVTDAVAVPESFIKYKYAVQAEYAGYKSMTVNTNGVGLGNIVPPYTDDFSDMGYLESYTAIDGNGDGRTWGSFVGMAQGMGPVYGSEDSHADEWLITPAIRLEGGKFYKFGISAASMGSTWTETFEVAVGNAPDIEAMTDTFLTGAEVSTASFMMTVPFEEYFSVPEDGVYYIGIHYNTPENAYFLLLDNLTISEPIDAMSPDAVTGLTVTPWPEGEKKATVAFTAPSTDLQGEPLPFLDRIVISLDGQPLHTITDVNPGQEISVDLDIPTSGLHKFTVVAYNGDTEGRPVETEVHVGLNVPEAPTDVKAVTEGSTGNVTITWTAPVNDIDGKPIPADEITYLIVRLVGAEQEFVAGGLKDTSYIYNPLDNPEEEQEFFQYAVFAHAEAGYSGGNITDMIAVGSPDRLPWTESFANGGLEHIMAAHPLDDTNGAWQNFGDQSFSMGVKSYDSDNGMIGMYGPAVGDAARLFTGRIDFTELDHPTLTFYTFNLQNADGVQDTNEIKILADCGDGKGFVPVKTLVVDDVADGIRGWAKATVDLTSCAGKTVQLAFDAVTKSYLYTLVDLVTITDRKDTDLGVVSISAPKVADPDLEFDITVEVENAGRLSAGSGYTVALWRNAVRIAELDGKAIEAGKSTQFIFRQNLNASDEDNNVYYAEIVCAADQQPDNDRSEEIAVRLRRMDLPGVRDLSARRVDAKTVELNWTEPEKMSDTDTKVTETFEDADTQTVFPTEYGNWTLLDEDKGYLGGLRGVELPGIQTGSQQGFWVMDAAHPVFNGNTSYAAQSGTKYLAQMYTLNITADAPVPCDDWIISPWLNEKAQTVEFYARSYGNGETHERFQFLYSTTGTDVEDFTRLQTVSSVPVAWTKYSFDVPESTRYFAIRCTSIDAFMLFVDDITYIPANGSNLQLSGYNLYVDGVRANAEPLKATAFTDSGATAGKDDTRYSVSAVYTRGESKAMHATVETSGAEGVSGNVRVEGGKGHINVLGDGLAVTVWSADGMKVYGGLVNGYESIPAEPGVYVVRYGNRTAKVFVR